ncbi:hypothetical protein Mpt1_c05940 [Candidatus Methanoplasma termitum]|uniref:DUF3788 family protein n=1 Tax=Candidatus Methanoplasma termitum TaxID=1577791 RepID=A0A0A7LG53_9ARCH|nr:DUF3788 family protein [Candidatus Methanoplasma termitum]AIZ56481.1 hypothetical protein Mpt1_c05940 [Candidatus Methanoplasma termitum]MCL2333442.1 DUF3788 domain-containing protein [Candidatus Methanoplasma sp.]
MEERQLLRDKNNEPTGETIAEGLGSAGAAYDKFIEEAKHHDIQVDWRYYNDGGWLGKALYKWTTARGTQKEMTAFWLSVWSGFFKVSLYFPASSRADALNLPLSNELRKRIENSTQMEKMKTISLTFEPRSDELFDEIFILVDFKRTLKR